MVGSSAGEMVSTNDLAVGTYVSVDHETYEIDSTTDLRNGTRVVHLVGLINNRQDLEVAGSDLEEPIWERV